MEVVACLAGGTPCRYCRLERNVQGASKLTGEQGTPFTRVTYIVLAWLPFGLLYYYFLRFSLYALTDTNHEFINGQLLTGHC